LELFRRVNVVVRSLFLIEMLSHVSRPKEVISAFVYNHINVKKLRHFEFMMHFLCLFTQIVHTALKTVFGIRSFYAQMSIKFTRILCFVN